jgi:hypothetical protein
VHRASRMARLFARDQIDVPLTSPKRYDLESTLSRQAEFCEIDRWRDKERQPARRKSRPTGPDPSKTFLASRPDAELLPFASWNALVPLLRNAYGSLGRVASTLARRRKQPAAPTWRRPQCSSPKHGLHSVFHFVFSPVVERAPEEQWQLVK